MLPRSYTLYKILVHNTTRTVNISCSEQLYICQIGLGCSKRPLSYGRKGNCHALAFCWAAPNIWPTFALGLPVTRHSSTTKKPRGESEPPSENSSIESQTGNQSSSPFKVHNEVDLHEMRLNVTHEGDFNKIPETRSNITLPNQQVQGKHVGLDEKSRTETKVVGQTPPATPLETPPVTPLAIPPTTPLATPLETPPATPLKTPPATPLKTPPATILKTPPATPLETPPATPPVTPPATRPTPLEKPLATPLEKPLVPPPVKPLSIPPATPLATPLKKYQRVDLSAHSLERNFITPVRAMSDFLLKPTDLEGLRKTKRRSPYETEPPITVFWRKDVEAKAMEVWGSREQLLKELLFRDAERRRFEQNIFSVKRRLKEYRRVEAKRVPVKEIHGSGNYEAGLFGSSGRVVLIAIVINMSNFIFKVFAWLYTGSHSMFSECVHSMADTINQLILAYGIHKSVQQADSEHPYGYANMKYVASLISGVGIFCVGTGLSIYHGVTGLLHPEPLQSFYWAFYILGGSLVSEGATLLVAVNSIRKGAKKNEMTFSEYVLGGHDPSVNVVLMEDFAAVIGVLVAGSCMGLTAYYGNPMPDSIGSLLVGGILGGVASFIIYTNVAALVGRSIPQERIDKINSELEADVMIRAIHDVKGIDMGNSLVRYKAEMDFDGRELTRSYLDKQDLAVLYEEIKSMQNIDELEMFMLKHGENIVDLMGGEIDRIEMKLRKKHPEVRHCDLEIL